MKKNKIQIDRQNLRQRIDASGLKKYEIARRLSVTPETISHWLSGRTKNLEKSQYKKLMEVLDASAQHNQQPIGYSELELETQKELQNQKIIVSIDEQDLIASLITTDGWSRVSVLRAISDVQGWFLIQLQRVFTGQPLELQDHTIDQERDFDSKAKIAFVLGLEQTIKGDYSTAKANFRTSILNAQQNWLIPISHFFLAQIGAIEKDVTHTRRHLERAQKSLDYCNDTLKHLTEMEICLLQCRIAIIEGEQGLLSHLIAAAKDLCNHSNITYGLQRIERYEIASDLMKGESFDAISRFMEMSDHLVRESMHLKQEYIWFIKHMQSFLSEEYAKFLIQKYRMIGE